MQRGVAHDDGRCEIPLGPLDDLAGELLVPGNSLGVGVRNALDLDVKPGPELVLAAQPVPPPIGPG